MQSELKKYNRSIFDLILVAHNRTLYIENKVKNRKQLSSNEDNWYKADIKGRLQLAMQLKKVPVEYSKGLLLLLLNPDLQTARLKVAQTAQSKNLLIE